MCRHVLTLDRHLNQHNQHLLIDPQSSLDQHLIDSGSIVGQVLYQSTLNGVSALWLTAHDVWVIIIVRYQLDLRSVIGKVDKIVSVVLN